MSRKQVIQELRGIVNKSITRLSESPVTLAEVLMVIQNKNETGTNKDWGKLQLGKSLFRRQEDRQ